MADDREATTRNGESSDERLWELEQLGEEPSSEFGTRIARSVKSRTLAVDLISFCWRAATHAVVVFVGSVWRAGAATHETREDRDA